MSLLLRTTPPRLGHDVGLAIARQVAANGDQLEIRLEPPELGRVDVSMAFDDRGTLRAVVAADSALSLDLLRRDRADLGHAMANAGISADAQSFRFEGRDTSRRGEDNRSWQPPPQASIHSEKVTEVPDRSRFRSLNWRGQLDVLA